ncbi:hypothetical protein ACEQ8H_002703 [Pleosporales sp. CAS-2024a]
MPQLTSPRLPGVPLLDTQYTGPEYSRWRRSIKFALEAKGTWRYCSGECTMPMPSSRLESTANLQHSLLEERRKWVRYDRDVKLDIFLSLTEEIMLELFEVGPPLPPSNMSAQQMLEALDERFAVFKFESYHHAFCHFLNIHIDQFPSVEEFNTEFLMTLEDLLDHGHPLSNIQACSAYFSKLRCTQNPWVARKLEEWDTQKEIMDCRELLKESPPWSMVRPLVTKPSHNFVVESIPEEYLEDSSASESDSSLDKSDSSSASSISLHSRNASTTVVDAAPPQDMVTPGRQPSVLTSRSQEITICASPEAIAEMELQALDKELGKLPTCAIPERGSSKDKVPGTRLSAGLDAPLLEWLASKKSVARKPPPPADRPLPPLPPHAQQTKESSWPVPAPSTKETQESASHISPIKTLSSPLTPLRLESVHPSLRPQASTPMLDVHPALRPSNPPGPATASRCRPTFLPRIDTSRLSLSLPDMMTTMTTTTTEPEEHAQRRPSSARLDVSPAYPTTSRRRPSLSTPNLAIPWPSTPDIVPRPHSSRAALPFSQAPNPMPSLAPYQRHSQDTHVINVPRPTDDDDDDDDDVGDENKQQQQQKQQKQQEKEEEKEEEEAFSLPLQGTRDSAWEYLYEAKGGYLMTSGRSRAPSARPSAVRPPRRLFVQTFGDRRSTGGKNKAVVHHKKSSSIDFVARLSGDGLFSSAAAGEEGLRKKMNWVHGVNLARFAPGKKAKEMI